MASIHDWGEAYKLSQERPHTRFEAWTDIDHPMLRRIGDPEHFFDVFRDITDRQEAERAVEESQERFRQLAEHIKEVFWITDPTKHRMIYISPGYEGVWGRSCESLYASPNRGWRPSIPTTGNGYRTPP